MKSHRPAAISRPEPVAPSAAEADEDELYGNAALASRLPAAASAVPFLDEMEALFGEDFSGVRASFGEEDALDELGADAAAEGEVVAFANAAPDRRQVAHELAHVVQTREHGPGGAGVSAVGDGAEQQAEAVADAVGTGQPAPMAAPARPTAAVHRDAKPGAKAPAKAPAPPGAEPTEAPASEADRKIARDAVRFWHHDQVDYALAMADFQMLNWNYYLSRTGGNQFLDWTDGQFMNVLINGVGTVAGALAPAAIGAAIGSAIAPGPGTIIGAVVGFLVSTIWGAISVAISNETFNKSIHTAKKDQGDQVAGKIRDFATERSQSIQNANRIQEHALKVIDDPEQESFVVTRWIHSMRSARDDMGKPPSRSDLSMANAMLREWVMQHAGTPTEENDETNGAAWDEARIDAFYNDVDETTVMARPELFSKQARYAWARLGLSTTRADIIERQIESSMMGAEGAKHTFDGQVTSWGSSTDEVALGEMIVEESIAKALLEHQRDQIQMLVVMGDWHLAAGFDLDTRQNSCYLDELDWAIRLQVPESFDLPSVLTWSTSPT